MMPFGLINAPTTFMVLMIRVFLTLSRFIGGGILVYSKNKEEHEKHLHVLQTLKDHQFFVNLKKVSSGLIKFLFLVM